MTLNQTLAAARAKIANPANWTKGWTARDADGAKVFFDDPAAVCWCPMGAIDATAQNDDVGWLSKIALRDAIGTIAYIAPWNDCHVRTHAEVIAAFDRAIAATQDQTQ